MSIEVPANPPRPADGHKGTFGTVVVFGGSPTMIGAPALTAMAALRTGAGLVKIATHESILPFCLTIEPSATGLMLPHVTDTVAVKRLLDAVDRESVLAVGPGMGVGEDQQAWLMKLLAKGQRMVLDADGLNNLAALGVKAERGETSLVLTPHPAEYRRLAEARGVNGDPTHPWKRQAAAEGLAAAYGGIVVLKGQRTIVADGQRSYINTTGNPALATAGSGDVLTGAIAALMAQGLAPFDAAVLGVYLHGLAADLWVTKHHGSPAGMVARDIANWLPHALAERSR